MVKVYVGICVHVVNILNVYVGTYMSARQIVNIFALQHVILSN